MKIVILYIITVFFIAQPRNLAMKISIHSDLHLEFPENSAWLPNVSEDTDIILLVGDINVGEKLVKSVAALQAENPQTTILFVAGNHEFYKHSHEHLVQHYIKQFASIPNAHFLENDAIELNGVRFLGCTLWTDFTALEPTINSNLAGQLVQNSISDFRLIRIKERRMSFKDMIALNFESVEWLNRELAKNFNGTTVVLTHFPPLKYFQHPKFPQDEVSAYFLNDLEHLVKAHKPDYWFFGHNHWNADIEVHGCRFVSNQRGYPGEREVFETYDEQLTVQVEY